jgi:hypothetical protein
VSDQHVTAIEGRPLPGEIVAAMERGEWKFPRDDSITASIFTEAPTSSARLYSVELMVTENAAWRASAPDQQEQYGGPGSEAEAEGYLVIDPQSSILIGDLGYDMPVALDYSVSPGRPRVVYLPSRAPGWIEVARDVPEFLRLIKTGPQTPGRSPRITQVSWGSMTVDTLGTGKDFKLHPGGGREWDWSETGTRHDPGIQPADVQELVDRGCRVVVLSRGMELRLQTMPETVAHLEENGIEVHVLETRAAVELYNRLTESVPVGGLFHSTC